MNIFKYQKLGLLVLAFLTINFSQATGWLTSFEDAKKLAIASDKLVLVDFWATWCAPCKMMDRESWSKDDIQLLMNQYVPVKIDIDKNKDIAQKYGVNGIPFIFIMDGNGKILYKEMSYKSKKQVIDLLHKYALNTSFLKNDMLNYFQKETFVTSFRLASKYQDYALQTNDVALRYDILNVAEAYFNESQVFLKDSEFDNKGMFNQKLELYDIQEYLILDKAKKALKKLEKLEHDGIFPMNQEFVSFLYYVAYQQLNDIEKSNGWIEKVTASDLKKSQLFITKS